MEYDMKNRLRGREEELNECKRELEHVKGVNEKYIEDTKDLQ